MAISTSCCLNISPPPSSGSTRPSSLCPNTAQVSWKEGSWKKKCAVGVACTLVSLQMGNLIVNKEGRIATAKDMDVIELQSTDQTIKIVNSNRWSDKRTCQPWRLNSLEIIVPENLPRPSFHRRWEAVRMSKVAPGVKASSARSSTGGTMCFSM